MSLKHLAPLPNHKTPKEDNAQSRGECKDLNPDTVKDAVSESNFPEAAVKADEASPDDEAVIPPRIQCDADNTVLRRSSRIRRPPIRYEAT